MKSKKNFAVFFHFSRVTKICKNGKNQSFKFFAFSVIRKIRNIQFFSFLNMVFNFLLVLCGLLWHLKWKNKKKRKKNFPCKFWNFKSKWVGIKGYLEAPYLYYVHLTSFHNFFSIPPSCIWKKIEFPIAQCTYPPPPL